MAKVVQELNAFQIGSQNNEIGNACPRKANYVPGTQGQTLNDIAGDHGKEWNWWMRRRSTRCSAQ